MLNLKNHFLLFALTAMVVTGCKKEKGCTDPNALNYNTEAEKDNGSCITEMNTPDSYDFEDVSYSGQTARIELLDKLSSELGKADDGQQVSEQKLIDIFENNGVISADKNISDKVYQDDKQMFYDYFAEIANLSASSSGGDTIIDGRFYNADGVEIKQMVEKGLMGALLYYQATSVYLEPSKIDVDNLKAEEGKGTAMAHHYDEAFGYLGVPKDFNSNEADKVAGDYTGSAWFWGHYILSREGAIEVKDEIFNAFIKGRSAIVNDRRAALAGSNADYISIRDEAISTIKEEWEKLVAANVVHYINSTIEDMDNNDIGSKWHHWSEAKAFHMCLKYNVDKKIGSSDWNYIDGILKSSPKNVVKSELEAANLRIQQVYGFSNSEMLNL